MSLSHLPIERIHAREVFDSRGKPTVEVEVTCIGHRAGRAIVPSGASTGQFEACELRDTHESRLGGLGVRTAVAHVINDIAPALIGVDAGDQRTVDRRLRELDGTDNKGRFGANAILGVSLATAYAAAEARGIPLVKHLQQLWQAVPHASRAHAAPVGDALATGTAALGQAPLLPLPMVNMISGGLHAGRNLDFQDFLEFPVGATSYCQALDWIVSVYHALGRELKTGGFEGVLVGDEGGFGPKLKSNDHAVDFVLRAIEAAGLRPGADVAIGLDVAATHFYDGKSYCLSATGGQKMSASQVIDMLEKWVAQYPIVSIEDALADDDWAGWEELTQRLGKRVQLIGDDLFVTNVARLQRGIEDGIANSVLIKVNQIGTLSETLDTLRMAIDAGYRPVVSARSGETEDATIADLAVATGAGQIKIGSVARSERLAKYNQLLRLEEQLGDHAGYLGGAIFGNLR